MDAWQQSHLILSDHETNDAMVRIFLEYICVIFTLALNSSKLHSYGKTDAASRFHSFAVRIGIELKYL